MTGAATLLAINLAALLALRPAPAAFPAARPATGTLLAARPAPPAPARVQLLFAIPAPQERVDPWFGDDKLRHLAMSFSATSFAYAAARAAGVGDEAPVAAAAAGLAAGIGKELWDVRSRRFFSLRDLAWDAAGVLAGYALARSSR